MKIKWMICPKASVCEYKCNHKIKHAEMPGLQCIQCTPYKPKKKESKK